MKKFYLKIRKLILIIIDRLTQKKGVTITINSLKLNLQGKYLRYFPSNYEEENFSFIKNNLKQDMTCLDIGGHIGIYAIYMAKLKAGKIFSFEPTPDTIKTLKKTISLNHLENIIYVIQAAVSEKSGKKILYLNKSHISDSDNIRLAEANSLVKIKFGRNVYKEEIEVATYSIDDFAEENNLKIDFIKIDAEGSELEILKGAKKTILKDRPSGILGIHSFAYTDKMTTLLEIWDIINDYHLKLLYNNKEITKHQFLTSEDKGLLDLQFYPSN